MTQRALERMGESGERTPQMSTLGRFILLLAGVREGEPINSKTHLQKEMYILQKRFVELADEAGYEPDLAGPYSKAVEDEVECLESIKLIGKDRERVKLTADGRAVFDSIKRGMGEDLESIDELKETLNDLSKRELMALVYLPEPIKILEEESSEYEDVVRQREDLAMAMYEKDKISVQKAAQIAGMYLGDFLDRIDAGKDI